MGTQAEIRERIRLTDATRRFFGWHDVNALPDILWANHSVKRPVQGKNENRNGVPLAASRRPLFVQQRWAEFLSSQISTRQ